MNHTSKEQHLTVKQLFDDWPARYDAWFKTPIGAAVRRYEADLIRELLDPRPGEGILDAGCGTGVFTLDFLAAGAKVTGLDISLPMLLEACRKAATGKFSGVLGDMLRLPFRDGCFDKTVSVTALEFIADGKRVVDELFRVTRSGGVVVVATLNSLGSWATQRTSEPRAGEEDVWQSAIFRSPDVLQALGPVPGVAMTAVHFPPDVSTKAFARVEREGRAKRLHTGAFVAARWVKP